jgi:hypothetical protein
MSFLTFMYFFQLKGLYTTDFSLSEKVEEVLVWEIEGLHRDVKAMGLLILEEGEAPGSPRDLHRDQRRQGAGEGAEPEERGGVPQVR